VNTAQPRKWPTPRLPSEWPVLLLALPAFVAIWGGWVGLGELTGFGPVNLLPGIGDGWTINTAITLPIGVEAYAAYALRVWLQKGTPRSDTARTFAMWSAIGSLFLGAAGQVAYHLMDEAGMTTAPWQITTFVSCLPVVVLGCGAALAHLCHAARSQETAAEPPAATSRTPVVPALSDPSGGQEHAVSVTPPTPDTVTETAPQEASQEVRAKLRIVPSRKVRNATPAASRKSSRTGAPSDEEVFTAIAKHEQREGALPSANRLKTTLSIGASRAKDLLDQYESAKQEVTA
jgi:hypothetical protein